MISHTKSFAILKQQAQRTFDFAIVVTYAVPALKYALKDLNPNDPIPFSPDHFDTRPIATEKVRCNAMEYKKALSSHIFLSTFSFFEAYFRDIIKEIIEFHGSENILNSVSIDKNKALGDAETVKDKRKLQEYYKLGDRDRYSSFGHKLHCKGFRFPSTLLSRYGLQKLIEQSTDDSIKASDIPLLSGHLLQLELDQKTEIDIFHNYRNLRNRIAHGRASEDDLFLRKAIEANYFLRNLALKIDKHVIENFLVIERF